MSLADVNAIARQLSQHGFRSWLVGGAVRDMLLGYPVKDFDIATDAKPEQVKQIFPDVIPTGERFGSMTVMIDGRGYEVTTLRKEAQYVGHHPQVVEFTDQLQDDMARRDFTINAMAVRLPLDALNDWLIKEQLYDFYGGYADLTNRIVRAVGNPEERFREDPLRLMRAVRLATDLDFFIEDETRRAIRRLARLLKEVPVERIRQELERILLPRRGRPGRGLLLLEDTGLLPYISRTLANTIGVTQDPEWHAYDVWDHTRHVVDAVGDSLRLRLAALYHDVGKPLTRSVSEDGRIHFYGHEKLSAELALEDLKRLTFPTSLAEDVATLCREHMFDYHMSDKAIRRLFLRLSPDQAHARRLLGDLFLLRLADLHGKGKDDLAARLFAEYDAFVDRAWKAVDAIHEPDRHFKLAITGHDIMRTLGLKPGPEVGRLKQDLLDWVLEDPSRNTWEALLKRLAEVANKCL